MLPMISFGTKDKPLTQVFVDFGQGLDDSEYRKHLF